MERSVDVVIVGGGIAGSAIAAVVAACGRSVLVLERQTEYKDRVRGETMMPWGVVEMRRLGVEDVLVDAGGGFTTTIHGYDEVLTPEEALASAAPLGLFADGVPGFFNCGHPQACEALAQHAAQVGATVVRGVGDVDVTLGDSPTVAYTVEGHTEVVGCRFVVGADGRQSVVRKAMGLDLQQVESKAMLGGMLVEGVDGGEVNVLGTKDDQHYLVFPRPNGYARIYSARMTDDPVAAGADRAERFLEPFRNGCFPGSEAYGNAVPAGPCAFYPGVDAWTDLPLSFRGSVLVGDAAGWSDPIIGQGLSIAMRDARTVAEILCGDDWSPTAFAGYTGERSERMRRIRFLGHLDTELRCTFTEAGRRRRRAFFDGYLTDPSLFNFVLGLLGGPEIPEAETFTPEFEQRVLALG